MKKVFIVCKREFEEVGDRENGPKLEHHDLAMVDFPTEAQAEAERAELSRLNPEMTFVVLQMPAHEYVEYAWAE